MIDSDRLIVKRMTFSARTGEGEAESPRMMQVLSFGLSESLLSSTLAPKDRGLADERTRLGPSDDYVGLSVREATRAAIGDPIAFLPMIVTW